MRRSRSRTSAGLTVSVTDGHGRAWRGAPAAGLGLWLRRVAPAPARGHVAIALLSDAAIRRLNRAYRGIDRPTDVLSFPGDRFEQAGGAPSPLGDIAISLSRAGRQARDFGHGTAVEVRLLALHGLLHLLGYDHDVDDGRMARVEERLRRRAGLPPGLVVRAGRPSAPRRR